MRPTDRASAAIGARSRRRLGAKPIGSGGGCLNAVSLFARLSIGAFAPRGVQCSTLAPRGYRSHRGCPSWYNRVAQRSNPSDKPPHTDLTPLAQKRRAQMGAIAAQSLCFPQGVFLIGQNITNLNGLSFQQHAPDNTSSSRAKRKGLQV